MLSDRSKKRTVWLVALAASATIGSALAPASFAHADDEKTTPGAPIIRTADRGTALAGGSTVRSASRGTAWSDLDDASKGAPTLVKDGNLAPLCFANQTFTDNCGLP